MRVAIVTDIHGNRHAFEAVLAEVRRERVDETWCLGDLVGYGAEPDACVALASDAAAVCLAGNHDLAVTGVLRLDEFSRSAGVAARWTREHIGAEALTFLRSLQPSSAREGIGLYHGSPRDPVWEYVLSEAQAAACIRAARERVILIGHSHVALSFAQREDGVRGDLRPPGEVSLVDGAWLINPGSVGQPRDGDPRAAWLLLDLDRCAAEWRRTAYDIEGAAAAIRAAGLPATLADRLHLGQ